MPRNPSYDVNSFGAQNAAAMRAALDQRPDPRLLDAPSDAAGREEDTQRESIAYLERMGLIVLQTSVRYRLVECERCHHMFHWHGDTGQTPGIPDTLVRASAWQTAMWMGVEMKGKKTPVSKAQRDLRDGGHIVIAKTVAQAVAYATAAGMAMEGHR